MPSVNLSSVAQKSGSHAVAAAGISATDARQVLRDMRAQLVGQDGNVSSGYLSINTRKDGSIHLETRGRHEWGSFHSDKKAATEIVKNLVRDGFGKELSGNSETYLLQELNKYLTKTGDRIGTQSFVNLIDRLDEATDPKHLDGKIAANIKSDVRFKANSLSKPNIEGPSSQAKPQFAKLHDLVRPDTAKLFEHLLSPGVSKSATVAGAIPTQVVGDADGSICRTMLAAINSGHLKLEAPELELLAEVMDAESNATFFYNKGQDDPLEKFQKNPEIAEKLDQIVDKANFQPGQHKLLFIGDIIHDRFCNNKQAMDKLIRGLHAQGAVFITGNHDVYDEVNPQGDLEEDSDKVLQFYLNYALEKETNNAQKENRAVNHDLAKKSGTQLFRSQFEDIKLQNGFHGARQLDKTASDQLIKDCFTNAHFDAGSKTLYTHNGFQHSGVGDVYLTANGFIRAQNAEQLAHKMNACDFNGKGNGIKEIEKEVPGFAKKFKPLKEHGIDRGGYINKTSFRPEDSMMTTKLLGPAGKNAQGKPITVVHGHNDNFGGNGNVENLNARSNTAGVKPITKLL